MTGAVGRADELREDVAGRIGELLGPGEPGVRDVFVGWVAALDAAGCPVRYRASGADGWGFPGWSPALAAGAVRAGRPGPPPRPHVVTAHGAHVARAARSRPRLAARGPARPASRVAEWIAELGRDGDRDTVAATAANATRWLAGFVRVMGWPLPDRMAVVVDNPEGPHGRGWQKHWRPAKGSPVCVASSPDATLGKVAPSGEFDLVVHRPSAPADEALADRAAFEAAAGSLSNRIVPASILVTTADTGEHARFPVSPALLGAGPR